jgi:hypothetical protein
MQPKRKTQTSDTLPSLPPSIHRLLHLVSPQGRAADELLMAARAHVSTHLSCPFSDRLLIVDIATESRDAR